MVFVFQPYTTYSKMQALTILQGIGAEHYSSGCRDSSQS